MTDTTKAAPKSTGRTAAALDDTDVKAGEAAQREAGKAARAAGAAKPRVKSNPRRTSPARGAATPGAAARRKTSAKKDAAAPSASGLPVALAALIENRRQLARASADIGTRLTDLTQAQLAAQIDAAQDLLGITRPADAVEIHRSLLRGTMARAAEGAAGWRTAMALWLGGAAALWQVPGSGATRGKAAR